jgi:hypothetical protein
LSERHCQIELVYQFGVVLNGIRVIHDLGVASASAFAYGRRAAGPTIRRSSSNALR